MSERPYQLIRTVKKFNEKQFSLELSFCKAAKMEFNTTIQCGLGMQYSTFSEIAINLQSDSQIDSIT